MATVSSILLVILTVHCAIALSQYETAERKDETSAEQLMKKLKEHDNAIKQLQESVREFKDEFALHFPNCKSCKCIMSYGQKQKYGVDISAVSANSCMNFKAIVSNQTYTTLSLSLDKIYRKITKLCCFNETALISQCSRVMQTDWTRTGSQRRLSNLKLSGIIIILFQSGNTAHKHEQETYRQTDRQYK